VPKIDEEERYCVGHHKTLPLSCFTNSSSKCRICVSIERRSGLLSLKWRVLKHYGPNGEMRCTGIPERSECREADIDILTLDHINDNGAEERARIAAGKTNNISKGTANTFLVNNSDSSGRGCSLYRKLEQSGFPEGYQVLCMNCQTKKELLRRRRDAEGRASASI
jgi:hypothetical protein